MTGPEIAAAVAATGKAVETVGKKALSQDVKTKEQLLKSAEGTPEMKAAAKTLAARIAVKERIKLKLYQPFARMIGVSRAYFEEVFPEEMAEKAASIPEDELVTPPASVVVPALQGLSYTFEEAELRELYLNLLTTATDGRRTEDTHPAFVEVIKQLSAREVRLLNVYLPLESVPIVQVKYVTNPNTGAFATPLSHLLGTVNGETGEAIEVSDAPAWVDNWIRLGLFEVTYSQNLSREGAYDWVTGRPEYKRFEEAKGEFTIDFIRGILTRTAFGEKFYKAVRPPA